MVRIGDRLKWYRERRGKTQPVVAGLAGISVPYLSQLERGLRTPTIPVLHRLASILRVRLSELIGEADTDSTQAVHPVGMKVSGALTGPLPHNAESPTVDDVHARVLHGWDVWQSSPYRYSEASDLLPDLITDLRVLSQRVSRTSDPALSRHTAQAAADLYFLLRTFCRRIGRTDLALLSADRGIAAAEEADDPVRIAVGRWNLGHALLAQDEPDGAEDVAMAAREELNGLPESTADKEALSGALSLVAAVANVRMDDCWRARDLLRDEAWPAARRTDETNVGWTVFGPTNVLMHEASVEMECGESVQALRLADAIDVSRMPSIERRLTYSLELARCQEQQRNDAAVLLHLTEAERTAPEDLRLNPMARDMIQSLLQRSRPTYASHVRALASRIGLLPE